MVFNVFLISAVAAVVLTIRCAKARRMLVAMVNLAFVSCLLLWRFVPGPYGGYGPLRLSRADLSEKDLRGFSLVGADLSGANLYMADLRSAILTRANFGGADLALADIRGARGLTCEQLVEANNWETSYRDDALACGAAIPAKSED